MTLLKDDERRWLEIATTRNMFATEISTLTERLEAERALLKQAKALIHAVIDVHLADELVSNDLGDKLSLLEWVSDTFEHGRNCAANIPGNDEDCTCGLRWRIQVRTEQEMHAAWRKRAEEAEAELSLSRQKVEELERELAHEKSRHCIGGDIFEAGRNRLILNQATELEYLQRAEAAEQQAASSAALAGQMRVALEQCRSHWGGYCITKDDQYKSVMENFWKHIRKCDIIIDAALSLPPSNALKKHEAALVDKLADDRHQCARELRDDGYVQAANDMDEHGDWLREKANELRASALESECAEAGKDVGDGM